MAAKEAVAQAKEELGLGHYKRLPAVKRDALEDRALEILIERFKERRHGTAHTRG